MLDFTSVDPRAEALKADAFAKGEAAAELDNCSPVIRVRSDELAQAIPAALACGEAEEYERLTAERDALERKERDLKAAQQLAHRARQQAEERWANAVIREAYARSEADQLEAHVLVEQLRRHFAGITAGLREYREVRALTGRAPEWPDGVYPWALGSLTAQLYAFLREYEGQQELVPAPSNRGRAA